MNRTISALLAFSTVLLATSLAALPERSCSKTLNLCTQDSRGASVPSDCVFADGDPAPLCNTSSLYLHLEQTKGIVAADDCLQVNVYPGTYTLSLYTSILNYSAVISAPVGGVNVTCESKCVNSTADTSGSPLWFQRNATFSEGAGDFFVQLEGIRFESCQRPLQFDAMDYVGISNCTFTNFTSSAVDIFNCQRVQVESSLFHNCNASMEKDQFRANSGGLSIAYHTNDTVYYDSSLPPWVHVSDCVFTQNRVLLPGDNTQQQINQALNNHFYFGRGGGFGIFLDEFFINITVKIESCVFEDNYADSFGGGLYLYLDGSNTQHNFTVRDCNFTGNSAGSGSFGGGLQVAMLLRNANSEPSRLDFIRCNFIRNNASFGGGMSTVQVYSQGSGNMVSLSDSHFEGNSAIDVGSAVMFASLLYVQNRNASYHYRVSDNVFFNNMSPGGVLGAGFIHQDLYGHNQFLNNTGPGLRIVGSLVTVRDKLSFIGNDARNFEGGAVYISAFGQVKLYRGAEIHFINNMGRIGSSIVVNVQRSSEAFSQLIFNTQCFLLFEDAILAPNEWDNVTVRFSGNSAQVAPVVYISHLSLCSWFSVTRVSNDTNQIEAAFSATNFTLWPVWNYSSADNMAHSHSEPQSVKYYVQTEAIAVTSSAITEEPMAVYPGKSLQLNLVGQDLFENPTYFIARISDSRADINSGAFSQATDDDLNFTTNADNAVDFEPALIPIQPSDRTVRALYRVPSSALSSLKEGVVIRVVVDTPYNVRDSQRFNFSLSFTYCLPGYELMARAEGEDDLQSCTCLDSTFNILACDSSRNVIVLRDGLWASRTDDANPQLEVHTCPTPYCQCSDMNITCDNLYYHDDPDYNKQCHALRTGTLCGQCVNGTGVGVLRFNCRECNTEHYWSLGFLVIGDIVVCVAILVVLVKLRYTFPHSMKGFLFYIQTVYYSTAYFPASFWDARQYMLYISSAIGLYFPWDFCLFPGMSALTSFPSRFVPVTIATIVAIASLISVFHFFEKRAQKRIWHGLWAFVLLLYAPLVYNCTILLHCPVLPSAEGGDTVRRWFLDGEVVCFREAGHIVLGLIAIILLTLLSLMLPALFIFTLIGNNPQLQAYSLAERLYGALSAGYHERARWWGVWDLARRLLLIGIVVALPGRSVAGLYIIIPALAAHIFFLPYLKWWQNLLEALVLGNYILLLLLRSTQTILDDLVSYSGTTVPQSRGSDLAEADKLTALFSFWYYLPLVMAVVAAILIGVRGIVIQVQSRRERTSTFDVVDSYSNYDNAIAATANRNVTVTHVSIT